MEPVLNFIQSKISEYQCSFLASLVEAFSYGTANERLNEYQEWRDAKPTDWLNQLKVNLNEEENTLNNVYLEGLYIF